MMHIVMQGIHIHDWFQISLQFYKIKTNYFCIINKEIKDHRPYIIHQGHITWRIESAEGCGSTWLSGLPCLHKEWAMKHTGIMTFYLLLALLMVFAQIAVNTEKVNTLLK